MGRFGVWGHCDNCDQDTWVVAWERDELDEVETWICGGGCDPDDLIDDDELAAEGGASA